MPATRLAILEYYRRTFSRLDARIRALLLHYAEVEARATSIVLGAMAAEKLNLRDRRRQEALAKQILRVLDETTHKEVPGLVNQAFVLGSKIAEMGTDEPVKGLSVTNRNAMKLLVENLIEDLGDATATVGRRVDDVFRKQALRAALSHLPQERPVTVATAEMQKALTGQGVTAFVDRAGKSWTLSSYSNVAVRSVAVEAVNASQTAILMERGIDLIEISKSKNPCLLCQEYDGKKFSLTGRATGHPVLVKPPPFHPLCEHIVFAAPDAFAERRAAGWDPVTAAERALAQERKDAGPVPV